MHAEKIEGLSYSRAFFFVLHRVDCSFQQYVHVVLQTVRYI